MSVIQHIGQEKQARVHPVPLHVFMRKWLQEVFAHPSVLLSHDEQIVLHLLVANSSKGCMTVLDVGVLARGMRYSETKVFRLLQQLARKKLIMIIADCVVFEEERKRGDVVFINCLRLPEEELGWVCSRIREHAFNERWCWKFVQEWFYVKGWAGDGKGGFQRRVLEERNV